MSAHHENNKRIVKNTLALYFRQIITMFVPFGIMYFCVSIQGEK